MGSSPASPWHGVALAKLTAVLGPTKAEVALRETLALIDKDELRSADDLLLFARALCDAGGFAGAVGGLLSVHAVLHGATGAPPSTARRGAPAGGDR